MIIQKELLNVATYNVISLIIYYIRKSSRDLACSLRNGVWLTLLFVYFSMLLFWVLEYIHGLRYYLFILIRYGLVQSTLFKRCLIENVTRPAWTTFLTEIWVFLNWVYLEKDVNSFIFSVVHDEPPRIKFYKYFITVDFTNIRCLDKILQLPLNHVFLL